MNAQTGVLREREQGVAAIRAQATQSAAAWRAYPPNPQVAVDYLAPDAVTGAPHLSDCTYFGNISLSSQPAV